MGLTHEMALAELNGTEKATGESSDEVHNRCWGTLCGN